VEQVIAKVKALATVLGASTSVTEQVYRAMISGFIEAELAEHAAQQGYAQGTPDYRGICRIQAEDLSQGSRDVLISMLSIQNIRYQTLHQFILLAHRLFSAQSQTHRRRNLMERNRTGDGVSIHALTQV